MTQGRLDLDQVVVHCFFVGTCRHTVEATDPDRAHAIMEEHYTERHRADLARLAPWITATDTPRR